MGTVHKFPTARIVRTIEVVRVRPEHVGIELAKVMLNLYFAPWVFWTVVIRDYEEWLNAQQ